MEALAYELGGLPKDLAVESKHASCLMILETWCKNNIDQILKQINQLQVLFSSSPRTDKHSPFCVTINVLKGPANVQTVRHGYNLGQKNAKKTGK